MANKFIDSYVPRERGFSVIMITSIKELDFKEMLFCNVGSNPLKC